MKSSSIAEIIASYLLEIKAVKLSPLAPFTWASGWKSPIYCDNRKTLSYPEIRDFICDAFVVAIKDHIKQVDVIVGVATAGIPQGVLIAQALDLPFAYVRSDKKSHGLENKIEGVIEKGQSAIVIEDLTSTGGSSLAAVDALRDAGCDVKAMFAIFTYDFPVADEHFQQKQCPLFTLSNYNVLIEKALREGYITESNLGSLKEWRKAPEKWGVNS
jgi:orotate phosphoribosyltransferase